MRKQGHEKVRIIVVDGWEIPQANLAIAVLEKAKEEGIHLEGRYQRLWGFTDVAQEVLVLGRIPKCAIIGDISWREAVQRGPSWFVDGRTTCGSINVSAPKHMAMFRLYRASIDDATAIKQSIRFAELLIGPSHGGRKAFQVKRMRRRLFAEMAFYIFWETLPDEIRNWPAQIRRIRQRTSEEVLDDPPCECATVHEELFLPSI